MRRAREYAFGAELLEALTKLDATQKRTCLDVVQLVKTTKERKAVPRKIHS